MKITYIYHSSFFLEAESCQLLFDYTQGELPAFNAGKPLYVFVSHAHHDHFQPSLFRTILEKAKQHGVSAVNFILSYDVPAPSLPQEEGLLAIQLSPHKSWTDSLLQVHTLRSNDAGVAFSISLSDQDTNEKSVTRNIYFAGDLNAWNWDGDAEDMALIKQYHEELSIIQDIPFDVAFLPLDPRLEEDAMQGITDFFTVCSCQAAHVFPMHCWGDYPLIEKTRNRLSSTPIAEKIISIHREGDSFLIP